MLKLRRLRKKRLLLVIVPVVAILLLGGGTYAALKLASSSSTNLANGLVAWWKMDGNARDSSGYNNNGTASGTSLTTGHTGAANSAYSFNGTSSNISVGDAPSLRFNNTNAFTVSAWIQTTSSNNMEIVSKVDPSTYTGYEMWMASGGKLAFYLINTWSSNVIYVRAPTVLNDGQWHNVTAVYDGSSSASGVKLYIDTVLATNTVVYNTLSATTLNSQPLYMGMRGGASNLYYTGALDDIRIYNRAISASEVTAIYNYVDPAAAKASLKADAGEKGLVGWWKMDGNAKDATPNASDCTTQGSPTLTTDRKGNSSMAYSFNGTSSKMLCGSNPVLKPTTAITMSAWVYPTAYAPIDYAGIVNYGTGGYWLYLRTDGRLAMNKDSTIIYKSSGTDSIVPLNSWHHVVGTYDSSSSSSKLYLDGQLVQTSSNATGPITLYGADGNSDGRFYIGTIKNNDNRDFSGKIDDVRIYNRALSVSEISSQYNAYNSQVSLYKPSGGGGSGVNLTAGLVGWWPFNGNAKDATPYSANGTLSGAVGLPALTTDRRGRANSAYNFSNANDINNQSIVVGNGTLATAYPNLNLKSDMTISLWLNPSSSYANATYAMLVRAGQSTDEVYGFYFRPSINALGVNWFDGSFKVAGTGGNTVSFNQWSHVVMVRTGSSFKFYVNGALVTTSNTSTTPTGDAGTLSFGLTTAGGGSQDFNGSIDDVRIYNRALSDTEVAALYNVYY